MPMYLDRADEARISAAKGARSALATAVMNYQLSTAAAGDAEFPASLGLVLDNDDSKRLYNPWWTPRMPVYIDDPNAGPAKVFVQDKTIEQSADTGRYGAGAIWYNPTNGQVNFRIPRQESTQETLDFFNEVNQASVQNLRQTTATP